MAFPEIATDRLILSELQVDDAVAIFELFSNESARMRLLEGRVP